MSIVLVLLPLALFLAGLPVFAVLLGAAAAALVLLTDVPPLALHQVMFGGIDKYALLAVPFFIFAGELMSRGGIAERLLEWVASLTGSLRGGLGVTAIGTATLMGAVSGSSPATVAALGKTVYPGLRKAGYGEGFSVGLLTTSGSIAIVIPPSIAMILYGASAEQSIPKLFAAGLLPGILISAMMAMYVLVRAASTDWAGPDGGTARPERQSLGRRLAVSTRRAWVALLMPVVVLAGIYLGWFSPTEAGGVACAYAVVASCYIMRSLSWRDVLDAAGEAARLTAQVLVIVAGAAAFSWMLTVLGLPQALLAWIIGLDLSPAGFLIAVNAILLAFGCVLDPTSAILVLAPILVPIAVALGVDPIHFGIIMVVNLSIGMFTPPFGLNIFVAQSIMTPHLQLIWRGTMPFLLVQLLALLIITFVPALSLWIANII